MIEYHHMDPTSIRLYFFNVAIFALLGAIFEIRMEKDKGWGGALDRNRWYGKIVGENNGLMRFLAQSAGVPYFFGYAVAVYFVLVPGILLLEYLALPQGPFLFIAIYFSILAVEDFAWFLLNPYFSSLTELLKGPNGSVWWHKKWIRIGNGYLPRSYFTSSVIVAICLILERLIRP